MNATLLPLDRGRSGDKFRAFSPGLELPTKAVYRLPESPDRATATPPAIWDPVAPPIMDTLEALAVWRTWLLASYAPNTVEMYWNTAFRYLRWVPKPLSEHTEADVSHYLEATTSFRSASRSTYYRGLQSLFRWALRNGLCETDPTASIPTPCPIEREPRALSVEDLQAVRDQAYSRSPVRGFAFDLLFFSAGRINEVLLLRWADATENGLRFTITKSGKERTVPWTEGLRSAVEGLRGYFGEYPHILPRSASTVSLWLSQAGTAAGVPNVHPHLLRATSASLMAKGGAQPVAIQKVLGHAKLKTTQRYLAVDQADKEAAVGVLDELALQMGDELNA